MAKEAVLIAVHGMGETKPAFSDDLVDELSKALGGVDSRRILFDTIYYQGILQPNQNALFKRMRRRELDWIKLRKFLLYGFSDAAGLERRAEQNNSPYERTQKAIMKTLDRAYEFTGGAKPTIVIAQSLGGQVISNYLWDAQRPNPEQGVWKDGGPTDEPVGSPKDKYRRGRSIKFLYTTGCNIPIFVGGFAENQIKAIKTVSSGYSLRWKNYYDEDDPLGWSLKPLSPSYRDAVFRDYEINADGGFFGKLIKGWNPLSQRWVLDRQRSS